MTTQTTKKNAAIANGLAAGYGKKYGRTFTVSARAVTGFSKGAGRQVVGYEHDVAIGPLTVASVTTTGAVRFGFGSSQMPDAIKWADAQVAS